MFAAVHAHPDDNPSTWSLLWSIRVLKRVVFEVNSVWKDHKLLDNQMKRQNVSPIEIRKKSSKPDISGNLCPAGFLICYHFQSAEFYYMQKRYGFSDQDHIFVWTPNHTTHLSKPHPLKSKVDERLENGSSLAIYASTTVFGQNRLYESYSNVTTRWTQDLSLKWLKSSLVRNRSSMIKIYIRKASKFSSINMRWYNNSGPRFGSS